MTTSFNGYKRILRKIRSRKILNRIGSGKIVYFENPLEEIALKYIPGEHGALGKYFAKRYGRIEYEIDFDSSSILMGVMEGKQISKKKYDNYHLIDGVYWKRNIQAPATEKAVGGSWAVCGTGDFGKSVIKSVKQDHFIPMEHVRQLNN